MRSLAIQNKYLMLRYLIIQRVILYLAFYEYLNRLIQETDPLGNTTDFTYDPVGRRLSKTVQSEEIDEDDDDRDYIRTTYYVYDNEDIIMEYNHKGKITARYTHGLGIDEPLAIEQKGHMYYYHADGLGSIVALTDNKQKVVQTYDYDSFGDMKQHGNKVKQPYAFTGREWDGEIKAYHLRNRTLDPTAGRFTTKDKLSISKILLLKQSSLTHVAADQIYSLALRNPQMLNEYLYATNNPLTYTDPYGLINWGQFASGAFINTVGWLTFEAGAVVAGIGLYAGGLEVHAIIPGGTMMSMGVLLLNTGSNKIIHSIADDLPIIPEMPIGPCEKQK